MTLLPVGKYPKMRRDYKESRHEMRYIRSVDCLERAQGAEVWGPVTKEQTANFDGVSPNQDG